MLSGVEIAGLVLGAFPICIELLDIYRNSIKGPYSDLWAYRAKCQRFLQKLDLQKTKFKLVLKALLLPIVRDPADIDRFLRRPHPDRRALRFDIIDRDLRRRLNPDSYRVFCNEMIAMDEAMQELCHGLGVDGVDVRQLSEGSRARRVKKRLKFCFYKKEGERILLRLDKHNYDLLNIAQLNDMVRDAEQSRPESFNIAFYLKTLQGHASSLYDAFASSWTCRCENTHELMLLLEQRPRGELSGEHKGVASEYHVNLGIPSIRGSEHLTQFHRITAKRSRTQSRAIRTGTGSRINCLCQTLRGQRVPDFLGSVYDGRRRNFDITLKTLGVMRPQTTTARLSDLIRQRAATEVWNLDLFLTLRNRLRLALVITSSVVQLAGTPWLPGSPQKEDFILLVQGGERRTIDIKQLFLMKRFPRPATPASPNINTRHLLLRLGVLLVELCFGLRVEDLPWRNEYLGADGEPDEATDKLTVLRWLEFMPGEVGDEYTKATRRCLHAEFSGLLDFSDANFRHQVHSGVVEPIRKTVDTLWIKETAES